VRRLPFPKELDRHFSALVHSTTCPKTVADALIASQCVVTQTPLMTANLRDFELIDGLLLVPA
jgi:predicted nucleic acid-binding protein